MANVAVTNVTGSNPGPQTDTFPDTVQMPTGNLWKIGVFNLTLTPIAVAATTCAEQTFTATGIGLLTTDFVWVTSSKYSNPLGIVGARVTVADSLSITFVNPSNASYTPSSTASYTVMVLRVQPNWAKQSTGNQLDW
jgi:hypothetical protein